MTGRNAIAEHWASGDVFARIVEALQQSSKSLDRLTVEDLAPVDHLHARGLPATVELADRLPIHPGQRIVDIGCGLGGPARYIATRFGCHVSGVDLTPAFVETANRLTRLLHLEESVAITQGDGQRLPYPDASFDGGYAQHVTMNVPDRDAFFSEAFRVLRPGAFFALTEHGLGPNGTPHFPVPWSEDGSGSHLIPPGETRERLERAGFENVAIRETGAEYLASYRARLAQAEQGGSPPLGTHLLLGNTALEKSRNAARNIEEGRTHPIQVLCRRPA